MTKLPFFLILLLAVTVTTVPVFADDDEWDDSDDRMGFGEREDDEHEEDDRMKLGNGMSDMVLYVTIAATAGTIGYTGFKIISTKKPKLVKK